jgi:REP element-mobilizing transposase RayT
LGDPRVAEIVVDEIERGEHEFHRYKLFEYVVMPNHVHLLIFPYSRPDVLMRMLKGNTGRRANDILNRKGLSFWQYESFDHWCRSVQEVQKIREYIMQNPVKCGLAQRPQDWPWSSAHRRLQQRQARLVQRVADGAGGGD